MTSSKLPRRIARVFRPFNLLVFLLYLFLLFPSLIVIPISFNGTGQMVFPPIDPSFDLYGETIDVRFLRRLRDEQKFDNLELLKQQIQADVAAAHRYFHNENRSSGSH